MGFQTLLRKRSSCHLEYDPKNSTIVDPQATSPTSNGHGESQGPRGDGYIRGRGRGDRGSFIQRRNNNRADFSLAGPNHDRSIATIVVEQIPEERFDETLVRRFFSEFGNIKEVTMQPYKRLALVKFEEYAAARRAYESPKVIFDNRFVKVYWYKPGGIPTPPVTAKGTANPPLVPKEEDQPIDMEKFERDAVAAQKKLEEKKLQMKDVEAKRQALEKQKEELARKQTEEKQKLLEKLAAKGIAVDGDTPMNDVINGTSRADKGKVSAHTKALREKVAELEAEAKSLGLDSALSENPSSHSRGRGRGRGRASYRGTCSRYPCPLAWTKSQELRHYLRAYYFEDMLQGSRYTLKRAKLTFFIRLGRSSGRLRIIEGQSSG